MHLIVDDVGTPERGQFTDDPMKTLKLLRYVVLMYPKLPVRVSVVVATAPAGATVEMVVATK